MNRFGNWKLKIGNWRERQAADRGVIVPTMVFIMLALTVSALAIATFTINHSVRINTGLLSTKTLLAAEAGAEQTLYELNQNSAFSGFASEQNFFDEGNLGRATYETEVTDGTISNEKLIVSTARLYRRSSDTTPIITRKVRLTVVGTTPDSYSVQVGPGGLIMENSATISNGEVYVNGYLSMKNSSRIGSATNPVDVFVAHINCPSGGGISYPTQCTSGQPITIENPARIFGDVCATNQTNGSGMSDGGLQAGCTAPAVSLPTHDRQAQIDAVVATRSGSSASCSGSQTRTYAANTHITGDVIISSNCEVTVAGDVWIDGKFELKNSASIRVANSVTEMPVIMVDGDLASFDNNSDIIANSNDIAFQFITYKSAAGCSPNCTDVTGTDLYNSRNINTIDIKNSSLAAGTNFYARWSQVTIQNSGSLGSVIGQTVYLKNTGNISFGNNLSSGQSIWSIKNWQQIFD